LKWKIEGRRIFLEVQTFEGNFMRSTLLLVISIVIAQFAYGANYFTCSRELRIGEFTQFVFADDQSLAQLRNLVAWDREYYGTIMDVEILEFKGSADEYLIMGLLPNGPRAQPVEVKLHIQANLQGRFFGPLTLQTSSRTDIVNVSCELSILNDQHINDIRFKRLTKVPRGSLRCSDGQKEFFFHHPTKAAWSDPTTMPSDLVIANEHVIKSYVSSGNSTVVEARGTGSMVNENFVFTMNSAPTESNWTFDWKQVSNGRTGSGTCVLH